VVNPETPNETAASGQSNELDPQEAAAILGQTRRRAQRRFDRRPPLLMLLGAAVLLVVFGVVWLSVRHQHPYSGPSGAALAVLYGTLISWSVVVATVQRRARTGIGGRSVRQQRAVGAAFAVIWTAVYVFQGALHHAGVSHAIAYGIYPATAPLIIVGSAAATYSAAGEDWSALAASLGAIAVACGAAFAGPAGVWLVMGIGLSALVLAFGAARAWQAYAHA
jgi:hypothetical protein